LPRLCAAVFAGWAIVFIFLPGWSNEFAALGYVPSKHAQDWTQIVGLFSLGFAVLLNDVHRGCDPTARRLVARGVLAFALPCALLMTYWQIIPDRRWFRLDILNTLLLYAISCGCVVINRRTKREEKTPNTQHALRS
jgi:hypothetical protein